MTAPPLLGTSRSWVAVVTALVVLSGWSTGNAQQPAPEIPPQNRADQKKPPEVPGPEASTERARAFVEALRNNDPEAALPWFFPADAFRLVKGIKDPDRYHRKLVKVFVEDVATMRKSLKHPDKVELVRFELGRQKRWVERGKEANSLPYYATYKAVVTVRDGEVERELPMRVMINWGDQWYVTHLTRK